MAEPANKGAGDKLQNSPGSGGIRLRFRNAITRPVPCSHMQIDCAGSHVEQCGKRSKGVRRSMLQSTAESACGIQSSPFPHPTTHVLPPPVRNHSHVQFRNGPILQGPSSKTDFQSSKHPSPHPTTHVLSNYACSRGGSQRRRTTLSS